MPRRIPPVSAFGSEIMTALLRAAKSELRIPFPSLDMAMRFRQRIYQLRTAMREEKHRDYPIAMAVRIYIEPERTAPEGGGAPTQTIIRLSPADSEFAGILQRATGAPRPPSEGPLFDNLLREIEAEDDRS